MKPLVLYRLAANGFGLGVLPPCTRGRQGSESRPRLGDDEGVVGPITPKEVSHGSSYHTQAPRPNPSSRPHGGSARTGGRGGPAQGHRRAGPQGGGRLLEGDPLH